MRPVAYSPDPVVTSLSVLGLILAITAARHAVTMQSPHPVLPAQNSINPNTAPWWELTILPGLGETTARTIVDYRDAHSDRAPVFRNPSDLLPVSGIGPVTIHRIGPHLRFNE